MQKVLVKVSFAMIFMLGVSSSALATINAIQSDACPNPACPPSFVQPVPAGKESSMVVKGTFVDLSTRVEITGSGVSVSFGTRTGGSNSSIVVRFNVSDNADLGERTVKLRYAIETNGPDTFRIRVIRGGTVSRIEQRVPGLLFGTTRLIAPTSVPVNQRVRLVFTGTRIGNAATPPLLPARNVQVISCNETTCEIELEFTRTGDLDVALFDRSMTNTSSGLLFRFFYDGVRRVTITGTSTTTTTTTILPPIGSSPTAPTTFVDVAPRANVLNIFRRTGNTATVNGQTFLQVDDRWCTGMQIPATGSISQVITVPDIVWGVTNVGTANIALGFDSRFSTNTQILQTQNIPASTLSPGGTRDFTFRRANSRARVIKFAIPAPQGCFVNPNDPDFFEDPLFTVRVDINNVLPETDTNRANNSRTF